MACVLFKVRGMVEETPKVYKRTAAFTEEQIEAGLWLLLALNSRSSLGDEIPGKGSVLRDLLAPVARKVPLSDEQVDEAVFLIEAAKWAMERHELRPLSVSQCNRERDALLKRWNLASTKGALLWPPSSQTISARLGGGSWSRATARLGFRANSRGRARGSGRFTSESMAVVLREFIAECERNQVEPTLQGYGKWSKGQRATGRDDVASVATLRQRYGTWSAVLASVEP